MTRDQLGNEIRALREAASLTQQELADRAGLSKAMISATERGDVNITIDALSAIARGLSRDLHVGFSDELTLDLRPLDLRSRALVWSLASLLPALSPDERRTLEIMIYGLEAVQRE